MRMTIYPSCYTLAILLALRTVSTISITPASTESDTSSSDKSILGVRELLDKRIHWEGDRLVIDPASPFAGNVMHPFRTQTSRCDRDRGATGWICQLYPAPDPVNPIEPAAARINYLPVEANPHELGHCPDTSICVDVGEMIPPPDPSYPQQGIGPFAACLDRSHVINIVHMVNYKQKTAASSVGVDTDVKQQPGQLEGQTLDVITSDGVDVARQGDMEYIDIEVGALKRRSGMRPAGYKTLARKTCKVGDRPVRSCRIDKMPKGAERINVKGKTLNGGGWSGVNGNIIASNPHMELR